MQSPHTYTHLCRGEYVLDELYVNSNSYLSLLILCEVGLERKKEEQKGNKIILSFKKKRTLIMVVIILNKHSLLIPTTLCFNEVFSVRPVEWH